MSDQNQESEPQERRSIIASMGSDLSEAASLVSMMGGDGDADPEDVDMDQLQKKANGYFTRSLVSGQS